MTNAFLGKIGKNIYSYVTKQDFYKILWKKILNELKTKWYDRLMHFRKIDQLDRQFAHEASKERSLILIYFYWFQHFIFYVTLGKIMPHFYVLCS